MIITLPKDIIAITPSRSKKKINAFRFNSQHHRATLPNDVVESFSKLGVDMFVSPKEKCLYLTFGKREKCQFHFHPRTGYLSCKKLFEWAVNAESPIFDNYLYTDYEIDKRNKIVKLKLERE